MPSFAGVNIFGASCRMATSNDERATQTNAYFGLQGVETIDGGFRSRTTVATGIIYGNTLGSLAANIETARALDDGQYRTLVDTAGTSWQDVRIRSLQFDQNGFAHSQLGYCRRYQAVFAHLT